MIPERCRPWIEAALAKGDGGHAMADIEAGLASGDFSLVEMAHSASVLEIYRTPRRKVLNLFLTGGEPGRALPELLSHEAWLNDMARSVGARLELRGRRGWVPVLRNHGWREQAVILTKEPT